MSLGRKRYSIPDEYVYKYDHTHKWTAGGIEMLVCERCGGLKDSLGMWGDAQWRNRNRGWERPCQGFTDFWSNVNPKEIIKEWTIIEDGTMP